MLSRPVVRARILQVAVIVAGSACVLAASVVLPRYVTDYGIVVVPLALLAFLAAVVLFILPVETLPALALVIFAIVPSRLLPQGGVLDALPLSTVVLAVWALRRMILGSTDASDPTRIPGVRASALLKPNNGAPFRTAAVIFGMAFLGWAVFTLLRSSDVQTSAAWLISFTAGALLPLVIGTATREAILLKHAWFVLGGILGAYAVVEAVAHTNIVWGTLYSMLGIPDSQHWSVYRAEGSFGHPLIAALFFAIACSLAIGSWLTTRSSWTLLAASLSGLGLIATVSRGAMLGGAIAVAFAFAASMVVRGEKHWGRFALLGGMALVAIIGLFQFDAFTARNNSAEAELSSQARTLGISVAIQAANLTGWIGSGPGTSGITGRLFNDVVIENSLLQLLISVGAPGVLLFVGLVGSAFLHALSRRAVGPAAGLAAYSICICAFNALDALRPLHLLLGCLLILTLHPGDAEPFPSGTGSLSTRTIRRPVARPVDATASRSR